MITTGLRLNVPVKQELRLEIRKKTEAYVSLKEIPAPASFDELSQYASELIAMHGWDEEFLAFVIVCCGNAVWQPVISSVPYERRILLLPQCLKNSKSCKAKNDEFGLLCNACGSCNISGLLDLAEGLGYVTIVTEGTTVASALVKSGKADAVIGVGCMETLQKMFDSVSKYSLPGIGIPLLTAGCTDTRADIPWIKEEILRRDKDSAFRLLNLNYLLNKTSRFFTEEEINKILGPVNNSTEKLVRESILTGGKRIRPLLTLLTYEAFAPKVTDYNLSRLALAIECFHKASLVHDDIEDNDLLRYGKETLHAKYGVPVAINAGDYLQGEGYRLITTTQLNQSILADCIREVASGHRLIALGQGMELMALRNREIPNLHDILLIFEYKTSTAFRVALLLGAIAGGADQEARNALQEFSRLMGIAYQIKDDLEDFDENHHDHLLSKPSIIVSLLFQKMSTEDQVIFQGSFYSCDMSHTLHFIDKYNIREHTEDLLKDYLGQIKISLLKIQNQGLKLTLHEIYGKIFEHYI